MNYEVLSQVDQCQWLS